MLARVRRIAGDACSRVARKRSRQISRHRVTDRECNRVLPKQVEHGARFDAQLVNAAIDVAAVDQAQKRESRISDSCSGGASRRGIGRMMEQTAFPVMIARSKACQFHKMPSHRQRSSFLRSPKNSGTAFTM
jgi:hypothetical protein